MFYIIVGICILVVIVVLWMIDKFAGSSEMMGGFKNSGFRKLMVGLSVAAVLSLAYGIYAKVTYQPPFMDISVNGDSYTVFGDIGEVGYYADGLVKQGEKTNIRLVAWEDLNLGDKTKIMISYPSGKEVSWKPDISMIKGVSINEIKQIYELSPYTFEESGDVTLTIRDKSLSFTIEVKEGK
ncbi:hypothetical protein CFK37_06375 [Virgibacillus phasianinus]|uniref:Uncharacterized protein n=1 Tax=Virgibacillus phasianinus TaxID=2017483 RepID=A0A220U107_9BACI|nr:hypothetical protein [Virgibacillus phasianinus]ASK61808.1 hypothetical protein CFK37_06375 [Virgibacillus phasianinus]